MRALWIIAALCSAPALAAEQAQQFDLECRAPKTIEHYRVDLDRGEWCQAACTVTKKIFSITTNELVLEDEDPRRGDGAMSANRINRMTGAWFYLYRFNGSIRSIEHNGTCEKDEFSGFGDANRKF